MGFSLFNTKPKNTYHGLLKTTDHLPITEMRRMTDGVGNDTPLWISPDEIMSTGNFRVYSEESGIPVRHILDSVDSLTPKILSFRTTDKQRWAIRIDGEETTGNAGSDFHIRRYDDAGTFIDAPFTINRKNGTIAIGTPPTMAKMTIRGDGTNNPLAIQNGAGTSIMSLTNAGALTVDGNITSTTGIISGAYGAFTLGFTNPRTTLAFTASASYGGLFLNHTGSITRTSGNAETLFTNSTFAAAAGSAIYRHASFNYTINNSGAQTGSTTGIYLNATETALNGMTHNLMDLQVGGVSAFRVDRLGVTALSSITSNSWLMQFTDSGTGFLLFRGSNRFKVTATGVTVMVGSAFIGADVSSPSARLHVRGDGTNPIVRFEGSAGTAAYVINAAGTSHTITGEVNVSDNVIVGSTRGYYWVNRGGIATSGDGIIRMQNNVGSDFNRLQFGGGTSSFPSIKRSAAILQARLADDSDFTFIQGKLRTETIFTSDPAITANGFLTLYDADGNAFKVLAVAV